MATHPHRPLGELPEGHVRQRVVGVHGRRRRRSDPQESVQGAIRPATEVRSAQAEAVDARAGHGVRDQLPDQYKLVVDLGIGLGLRQGEIFGLSLDDIDLNTGEIEIKRQVKLLGSNRQLFGLPKGRKIRTVPLPTVSSSSSTTMSRATRRAR